MKSMTAMTISPVGRCIEFASRRIWHARGMVGLTHWAVGWSEG
jgi:hypothetical protein